MPSAHYQPLELRADDNDEDDLLEEGLLEHCTIETDVQPNGRIRYHPQPVDELRSIGGMTAPRFSRAASSGMRRFLFVTLILLPICFLIYFVISPQSQDSEDADGDVDPHNGIGKRRHITLSLKMTRLTTAYYHPFQATITSKRTHGSIRKPKSPFSILHLCIRIQHFINIAK